MNIDIRAIVPNTPGPVQERLAEGLDGYIWEEDYEKPEEDQDELDEWEDFLPKRTRNKRLEQNLKRADRRARYENYKELE